MKGRIDVPNSLSQSLPQVSSRHIFQRMMKGKNHGFPKCMSYDLDLFKVIVIS